MLKIRFKAPGRKFMILAAAVSAIILVIVFVSVKLINSRGLQEETIRGSLSDGALSISALDIDGIKHRYRQDLVNILIMGIDQAVDQNQGITFRDNGQADFLLLLTVNEKEKSVSMLQIDRDTIAEITVLTVLGQDGGSREAQICLAHDFGGTRERSSELTVLAVEKLLFGVPVDRYISVSMTDIGAIAEALGGVPVTITEEMEAIDPGFRAGEEVLLKGGLAERFVRQRYGIGDGSNRMRMQRQQVFITSLQDKIAQEISKGQKKTEEMHDLLAPFLFTNLSRGYMINLLYQTRDFKVDPIITVGGVHIVGVTGFTEFHPDREELQEYVVNGYSNGLI